MESAHQPASLAVHGCLSPRFRSDSRASDFYYKSADRPLSVAAVSPVECLPDTHHPLLTTHSPLTTFRINTCKSVSKQRTLTPSRINTYKNTGEGVSLQTARLRSLLSFRWLRSCTPTAQSPATKARACSSAKTARWSAPSAAVALKPTSGPPPRK